MLDKFESYMRSVTMSENTITSYRRDAREFLTFIESKGISPQEVDHGTLFQFLEHLTQRGLSSSTKRRRLEAVKTFYRAMRRMGELEEDPAADFRDMPKMGEAKARVLSEMEYRTLRDAVRSSRRKSGVRDYAILELALQTGLRRSEICSLTVDDVEFSTRTTVGRVRVRKGQGAERSGA